MGARVIERVRDALPRGSQLPKATWEGRHRAILTVLWLHVPVLAVVGMMTQNGSLHSLGETAIVAFFAVAATTSKLSRSARASFATVGLIASSAILVHFSGGLIEMHFHFFVMVAIVTLYQAWMPFLLAIFFVVLHHGTVGVLDPGQVYNHASAIANPWKWALIHGMFIAAESAAGLTAWKLNERWLEREREARKELLVANHELAEAQSMASIGSWDWDLMKDKVWWSDELYRILDKNTEEFIPSYEGFMNLVHDEDRGRVHGVIESALAQQRDFGYEARVARPDGNYRTIHALGRPIFSSGTLVKMTGTVQDITERKVLEERLEYQAFHDALTGLANRALFFDRVDHAMTRQERNDALIAILYVDLDDFKAINDSMGHDAGDHLLVQMAHRIHGALRPADTFARLGGDEFAVLLEDLSSPEQAVAIAQRILDLLEAPISLSVDEVLVRASIGIAFSGSDEQGPPRDLLRKADTAMSSAKRSGKASFEIYEEGMADEASERLRMKTELQRAIENDEFVLHYQPIVWVNSGEISGVEALVRWVHPEQGLIPPNDFIPLAEETGLILPLTRWVVEEACRTAASWTRSDGQPLTVAVNISPVRFRHPGLEAELLTILERTKFDPRRLTLEITESVLIENADDIVEKLNKLKELGVQLAIDDFGTGYSSLSYLRVFPIDLLKVDKAFVDSIALGPQQSALARTVVELGRTLGLSVVAEGVEHPEQAAVLRRIACDFAQGYLFSKPVEAVEIERILRTKRMTQKKQNLADAV